MNNTHYYPIRTCIACKKSDSKDCLLRIVKKSDGEIVLDTGKKSNGRGAYVCDDPNCINKVIEKKLLSKAFSCQVDKEVYERLKEDYANFKS